MEIRKEIAELIYKIIDGVVSTNDAIITIEQIGVQEDSIVRVLHALYHHRDDADIRQKDKHYAELQISALRTMADKLSQGQPIPETQAYW